MRCKNILLLATITILALTLIEVPPVSAAVETIVGKRAITDNLLPDEPLMEHPEKWVYAKGFAVAISIYTPVEKGVNSFTKIAFAVDLGDPLEVAGTTYYPYVKKMWVKVEGDHYYWPYTGSTVDNTGTGAGCSPAWELLLGLLADLMIGVTIDALMNLHQEPPNKEWKGAELEGCHWIEAIVREDEFDTNNRLRTAAANFYSVFEDDGYRQLEITAGVDIDWFMPTTWGPVIFNNVRSYSLSFIAHVPPKTPDINRDGAVDIIDIGIVCKALGAPYENPNWDPRADVRPEYGVIDIFDLVGVAMYFGS